MRISRVVIVLFAIIILGTLLRFYRLGDIPVGFHRDEAFLGYNAYSILKTARDMSGSFLPLHIQSFIYSPSGYSYFSIPFIIVFDLGVFSVRFASAFFGSITIVLTFFLTKELFSKYKLKEKLGLISALIIAVSPWHINLSRTATENTIVVFFISLGILFYLKWIKNNGFYLLIVSFICFGVTLLIYQAPRAFLPLFIPLLFVLLPKEKITKKKILFFASLFLITVLLPIIMILSSKDLSLRIKTVSIFATSETQLVLDQQIREDGVAGTKNLLTRVFHNKLVGYSQIFLGNYFSHFSYSFLFTDQGLPERYRVPVTGLLYIFDLPFLVFGLWYLSKIDKKIAIFLFGWLLFVPVGTALTFDDVPNLQRTMIFFPAISMIAALGFLYLLPIIKKLLIGKLVLALLFIIALFNIFFYFHQYYIHAPVYHPWNRQDGYKELVSSVNSLLTKYKKVVITNRESAPTVFFLFYSKYDPFTFLKEKEKNMYSYDRINFGKFEFSQEECPLRVDTINNIPKLVGEKGVLYIDSGLCNIPSYPIRIIATIKRIDNSIAFRILDIQ